MKYLFGLLVSFITFVEVYGICNNGWRSYKSNCYLFCTKNSTFFGNDWKDSHTSCQKYGGDLLDVEDEEENFFVLSYFRINKINELIWIGLNTLQQKKERVFEWSGNNDNDKTPLSVYSWRIKEPNNLGGNDDCVETNSDGWSDNSCDREFGFICKLKKVNGCANGWIDYSGSCYLFYLKNATVPGKNWKDSRSTCWSYSGQLLNILNNPESRFVLSYLKYNKILNTPLWIGLNAIEKKQQRLFEWAGNTPSRYYSWRAGEPNNRGSEDCVDTDCEGWNDNGCNNKFGFICKIKKGIEKKKTVLHTGNEGFVEVLDEYVLQKNNLIGTLPVLEKTYTVSFKLLINYHSGYKNVIHLTVGNDYSQYGDRTPSVFVYDNKLEFASAINGDRNYRFYTTQPHPLHIWSNIRISQVRNNGVYKFIVYINGQVVNDVVNKQPNSFKNVKVFSSNPWNEVQLGSIKDLRIFNGNVEQLIEDKETRLVKRNLIAVIPRLEKIYKLYFDFKPNSFSEDWNNVVRFTMDSNINYDDRVPGVWFDKSGSLVISTPLNGNLNDAFKTLPVSLEEWSHIEISQQLEVEAYIYTIKLNGEKVFEKENKQPLSFNNVLVYATDPWYKVQDGAIKDFAIINGNPDDESLPNVGLVIKDLEVTTENILIKDNVIATLPSLEKTYTISFKIKPSAFTPGWKSVIHLTTGENIGQNGYRTPGVFIEGQGGAMVIYSAINGDANYYLHTQQPLPLNSWSSVIITQVRNNGVFTFMVYIDGQITNRIENKQPQSFKNVKVFLSDPWHETQAGSIKELRILNGNAEQIIEDRETHLIERSLVAVIPQLEKIYKVYFDVKPKSFLKDYSNVVRFNIDSNVNYDDRVPGVWFDKSGDGSLIISAPLNGNLNDAFKTLPVPLKEWSHIEISQQLEVDKYVYTIKLNGEKVFVKENKQPLSFSNVLVYAADPLYKVQDGAIKDFTIINGYSDNESLLNVVLAKKDLVKFTTEEQLQKNNLIATLPLLEKTYAISFKIKPSAFTSGWKSVIHLTTGGNDGQNGYRTPGVFIEGLVGAMVIFSAINGYASYYLHTQQPLPLNTWSNIRISQVRINGVYRFMVHVNGKLTNNIENTSPQGFKSVKVFSSDPWYDTQPGFIKDLRIINGNVEQLIEDVETSLSKGNVVAVIPKLEKTYKIYFDVKPSSFSNGLQNVLHFTIGPDVTKKTDRAPGVWFADSGDGSLYFSVPINDKVDNVFYTSPVPFKEWSHIEIMQQVVSDMYFFSVQLNGLTVFFSKNNSPQSYDNVYVYASDPTYPSQDGLIKNLFIVNGELDTNVSAAQIMTSNEIKTQNVSDVHKKHKKQYVHKKCRKHDLHRKYKKQDKHKNYRQHY